MDRGARRATVHRVTHSQIQWKQLSAHAHTVGKLTVCLVWKKQDVCAGLTDSAAANPAIGAQMMVLPPGAPKGSQKEKGPAGCEGAYRMDGNYKAKERKSWEGRRWTTCFKPHHNVSLLFTKWSNP